MKHLDQEQLVAHYYGDGGQEIERHLADCYECRSEFAELQRTLAAILPPNAPARGAGYGGEVWDRVRAHLPEAAPQPAWWRMPRSWAAAGAMAMIVAAAFLLGRQSGHNDNVAHIMPAAEVKERVLMVALGDHLERSQMVLLEVTHAADAKDVDLVRGEAEDLVGSNRLYRQAAVNLGDKKTADVLDQLERALLEIAHSSPDEGRAQIEELRHQIEAQGLLFKVRVIHNNVQKEIRPAPKTSPTNPSHAEAGDGTRSIA